MDLSELNPAHRNISTGWQAEHPMAVEEVSAALAAFEAAPGFVKQDPHDPDEIWINDVYNVSVRRFDKDPVFGTGGGMVVLGISAEDGTARHDFRDMQAIKNRFAGEETEAFELYPAESRLLDPSNYYTLWCFPGLKRIKVGQPNRYVLDADVAFAPQRAFPK